MDYSNIILLSDMDGTLLDSNGRISDDNKEALKKFTEHGGKFGVATGRNQMNSVTFLKGIELNAPSILYNGGALYDFVNRQFLALHELKKTKLLAYMEHCMAEYPKVMVQVYNPDQCVLVSVADYADPGFLAEHQPCGFSRLDDILDKPWIKILFCGDAQALKGLEHDIQRFGLSEEIHWVFSSEVYLEFLPHKTSKGSMLTILREHMGKDYRIYAVGDYNNDMEMLKAADVGIAVGNALPELKEIADCITVCNDESAIAEIINHIIS